MEGSPPHKWEKILEESIDQLAKEVLYDLSRWEFERLEARDPSFESLAKSSRLLLAQIEELISTKLIVDLKELVELLESIALSIVERNAKLLDDCTTHLQEFIEIRSGRASH